MGCSWLPLQTAMNNDSLINLRVPAATKGRWIRASRAAGVRLTDYITAAVEAYMQQQATKIAIPSGLDFSCLKLRRAADGSVTFDWAPIEAICRESGIDMAIFQDGPEDNVAGLIVAWYRAHVEAGGAPDATADDLLAEVAAEDRAGMAASLPPGRA